MAKLNDLKFQSYYLYVFEIILSSGGLKKVNALKDHLYLIFDSNLNIIFKKYLTKKTNYKLNNLKK